MDWRVVSPAQADLIQVSYQGQITEVTDRLALVTGQVAVGAQLVHFYSP